MSINCEWLEDNFFGKPLEDKQKKAVCEALELTKFSQGDIIIAQGEPSSAAYIIYEGAAYIDCESHGEKIRVGTAKPSNLVGEMSFISGAAASATATAKEDCVTYKLSRAAFADIAAKDQTLLALIFENMLKYTSDNVRQMNDERAALQHYMAGNHF